MTLVRMLLRASGVYQSNLTFWLERLGQLSFQEINLEKMIFTSKKMSQFFVAKNCVPILQKQFYFHFNC